MKVRKYYYILDPKSKNPRSVIFPLSEFSSVCKWVLDRRTLLFALVLLTFWGVSKRVEMIWNVCIRKNVDLIFRMCIRKCFWINDTLCNIKYGNGYMINFKKSAYLYWRVFFQEGGKETAFGWEATSVLAASYSYMVDLIMVHVLNYAKRVGD